MAKSMPTYFKDSFALKEILDGLQVRPGTRVFTADATAMYQYIDPEKAIPVVAEYLKTLRYNNSFLIMMQKL